MGCRAGHARRSGRDAGVGEAAVERGGDRVRGVLSNKSEKSRSGQNEGKRNAGEGILGQLPDVGSVTKRGRDGGRIRVLRNEILGRLL